MTIQSQKTLSAQEQLDALAWAASRSGKSYGTFTARLTTEEKKEAYDEYLAWQEAEAAALAERIKRRRHAASQQYEEDEYEESDDMLLITDDEES